MYMYISPYEKPSGVYGAFIALVWRGGCRRRDHLDTGSKRTDSSSLGRWYHLDITKSRDIIAAGSKDAETGFNQFALSSAGILSPSLFRGLKSPFFSVQRFIIGDPLNK